MRANETCPVATTLDLIGGKYKALILWRLANAKMRYSELRKIIPNVTPKTLTQQLRELESSQLIHREVFPVIPPKVEYSLTERGESLMPVLIAMRDWGTEYLKAQDIMPTCFMTNNDPMI
jgi:DNA-binding HxlR family transcriptional regulator